jgi:nucleolar complex protein 2
MGKKATKATKKFASSGQLKKVIQARHKHQQIVKRTQGRRGAKDGKEKVGRNNAELEEDGDEEEPNTHKRFVRHIYSSDLLIYSEVRRP